jgi:hypothetical protein
VGDLSRSNGVHTNNNRSLRCIVKDSTEWRTLFS